MFAMAVVMKVVLGWDLNFSIIVSSLAVAAYVALGGLRSAIFNEVLQFVLIWGGALLVPILGLVQAGGWNGLKAKIACQCCDASRQLLPRMWRSIRAALPTTPWASTGPASSSASASPSASATGPPTFWWSSACWPRTILRAARMAPIIGSFFKMAVPFIVILPGLLGLVLLQNPDGSRSSYRQEHGRPASDARSCARLRTTSLSPAVKRCARPEGSGRSRFAQLQRSAAADDGPLSRARPARLGITALIAGFMSGMAGNVSAFSTVWTYDIYKPLINKKAPTATMLRSAQAVDRHRRHHLHRRRVPGDARARHHGLRAGALQFLHLAAAGRGSVRHVLEARHQGWPASGAC